MMTVRREYRVVRAVVVAVVLAGAFAPARAAEPKPTVTVKAFQGKPFGVGMITLSHPKGAGPVYCDEAEYMSAFRLTSKDGRILYPVFERLPRSNSGRYYWRRTTRPTTMPAQLALPASGIVAWFLFQGAAAFDVTLTDATGAETNAYTARVTPAATPEMYAKLLDTYWWALKDFVQETVWSDATLPAIENYVLTMLSRRLGRKMPVLRSSWFGEDLNDVLGVLVGAESVKLAMQRKTLLREAATVEKLDQPLPVPILPATVPIPRVKGRVPIEPMAMHVPLECFYLRCGSFDNFRWMRQFMDTWGAMARDMTASRSVDYAISRRIEKQLILKETALARLFGPRLISDVAIVGSDPFVREGASIGIIFESRSNTALSMQFGSRRAAAVKADPAVTEKTVVIAGHNVSLVSSPDNTVRSFYAVDGDYHLVATSQTLVRRFFEAGAGTRSLGQSKEFRWGRKKMPLSREDSLFVYLSDPFFRQLVSPQYRVEMTRRMRALSKIQLVYIAQLAARGEGRKGDTVKALIDGGFLPKGFRNEPDGSAISLVNGRAVDSLRGAAGTFLPTWDVEIKAATKSEVRAYKEFANVYRGRWEQMDPVVLGLKHVAKTDAGNERIVVDMYLTPYARHMYYRELERFLGPPSRKRIAPVTGNLVSVEVVTTRSDKGFVPDPDFNAGDPVKNAIDKVLVRTQRLFGGIQDCEMPFTIKWASVQEGDLQPETIRVYVGETPAPALAKWLGGGLFDTKPDDNGYYTTGEGRSETWGRAWNNFYVIGSNKDVLTKITPQLKTVAAKRPAQIRLDVKQLSNAKFAPLLNAYAYVHVRKASIGNALMLRSMGRLLRVGPDEALRAAGRVLGASVVCPLGGTYRCKGGEAGIYRSTAWRERTLGKITKVPADFRFAPLESLRRLVFEFTIDPKAQALGTHIEVDLAP